MEPFKLLDYISVVPDFPKKGINFYDIQSLLRNPVIWRRVISDLTNRIESERPDVILGIESRGFISGIPVALELGLPFGMIRKKGKLPGAVIAQEYGLEYGKDTIEIQENLVEKGARVVIVDDLMATGGTMRAAGELVHKIGGRVMLGACIIELDELRGTQNLGFPFFALTQAPLAI